MKISYNKEKALLWLVSIGFFMETLDSTITNTALPTIAQSLSESPLTLHAVVMAYSLTIAIWIPASGWISDRFGMRRTYFAAIAIFVLGSIFCALSTTLHQLVIARVIQGSGGSMLLPVGRLAVLRAFPREKFLKAISFVAIPALIGPLVGPTLGGFLVHFASWHWIFLINIPVGIIGAAATLYIMPDAGPTRPGPFDLSGFLRLAFGMVFLTLALEGLSGWDLDSSTVLILLFLGIASIASYFIHALRDDAPLFSLELFKVPTYTIGLFGNLFARIGAGAVPFLIPLLLQVSLGYTALQAGFIMLPMAAAAILSKKMVTSIIERVGYQRFLVVNTLLVGFSIAGFALISREEPLYLRVLHLLFFGTVNSLQFSAMNSLALKDLEPVQAAGGNSLLSMVQMLGMSFGVAAAGSLLASFSHHLSISHEAFKETFICMGLITCLSSGIFYYLSPRTRTTDKNKEKLQLGF